MTHALLAGSPAVDAIPQGENGCGTDFTEDQRGVIRPQGEACDIGAFELEVFTYDFSGFFAPVANLPTINTVSAGQAIPVRFSLGGDFGLAIFASGYPKVEPVSCDSGENAGEIEETVRAGQSSLSFSAGTQLYTYVWKSERSWRGSCRELVLKFDDGTTRSARFQFR